MKYNTGMVLVRVFISCLLTEFAYAAQSPHVSLHHRIQSREQLEHIGGASASTVNMSNLSSQRSLVSSASHSKIDTMQAENKEMFAIKENLITFMSDHPKGGFNDEDLSALAGELIRIYQAVQQDIQSTWAWFNFVKYGKAWRSYVYNNAHVVASNGLRSWKLQNGQKVSFSDNEIKKLTVIAEKILNPKQDKAVQLDNDPNIPTISRSTILVGAVVVACLVTASVLAIRFSIHS